MDREDHTLPIIASFRGLPGVDFVDQHACLPTRRNREVLDFTRYRVKNHTELTNFMKMNRIQGYNGKYGSNPQGIKEFLDVIFNFDQIGQEIDGRNWEKWYLKKVDFKPIQNQKLSNLDLISRRNQDLKWREISGDRNCDFG